MHQTIVLADAIGHDIRGMYAALSRNHECHIFGEYLHGLDGYCLVDADTAAKLLNRPDTVVIYHHSIHWELGERLLTCAKGPIIFRYHNVTPPTFFSCTPALSRTCARGREQTYRFATKYPEAVWFSPSRFNLEELGLESLVTLEEVPPFTSLPHNEAVLPDEDTLRRLINSPLLELLFVGRFAPNKGHLFLIDVVRRYRDKYGPNVHLNVVGKYDPSCSSYFDSVRRKIVDEQLEDQVAYIGEAAPDVLLSYFLGCDAYVCCSEHEGFCVPVVEAQSLLLPLVVRAKGAVPETVGEGQIVLGEDPRLYADSLYMLQSNDNYRKSVIDIGFRNYSTRFTAERVNKAFRQALQHSLGIEV